MMRVLILISLVILYGPCSKNRPQPQPFPQPVPTVQPTPESTVVPPPETSVSPTPLPSITPSPSPRTKPTPYPVPQVDLVPYLHEQGGRTVTVDTSGLEDVGTAINEADSFDGPGKLVISGGGKIRTQVVLSHDVTWSGGTYSLETETLEGSILLHDGVKNECVNGATFLEPTFFSGTPAITVFQTYASAKNNYAATANVTVKGCRIVGRQEKTDGGVRQAISFGNCKHCAAIENDLSGIASIGISFGGGAADGNHAEDCLAYGNKLRHFAAAAIAGVNVKGLIVDSNDIADPGRKKGEPGGVSAVDIESNNTDDCVQDIRITANNIGYGAGAFQSIGNAILGQNVYKTPCSGGLLIANNVIDGYQGKEGLENSNFWGLSGGLYFVGNWQGGLVVNNKVIRALQPGISLYGVSGLTLQDNWLISCGGGGQGSVYMEGSSNNTFLRVRAFDDPSVKPGSTGWWVSCDQSSGKNIFQDVELGLPAECKR